MRTKQVRIPLVINAHGEWSAVGGHELTDDDAKRCAADGLDAASDVDGLSTHWITAEVPVPAGVEIEGQVEAAE